jgi:ubiquinone/menaquinone biosynthesis C-methylase UbiE
VIASDGKYIHGYDLDEQRRLVDQAEFWRDTLILPELRYQPGQQLLEIGCGAGAVLGVLATAHPALRLAGIDLVAEQIGFARQHLTRLGHGAADLRVGDATALPWPEASFDHVYMMWFLEHVPDPAPFLREARRVLRPGGTITINETDYDFAHPYPASADIAYLIDAERELFRRNGNPAVGRSLGAHLAAAGFAEVRSRPIGFHHSTGGGPGLSAFVAYLLGFLEPMVPRLSGELGRDSQQLRAGIAAMRALPALPVASFTQIVFRASGVRA